MLLSLTLSFVEHSLPAPTERELLLRLPARGEKCGIANIGCENVLILVLYAASFILLALG